MAAPPLAAVRPGLLRVSCSASTAPSKNSNSSRQPQQQVPRLLPAPPLSAAAAPAAAMVPLLLAALPPDALAAGGEFGILEGRSFALLHPLVMGGLFGYTLWAGYLGWQWRRVRTVQDEINELKKQVKPAAAAAPAAVGAGDASSAAPPPPAPKSPAEIKIDELTEVTPIALYIRGTARLLQERNCSAHTCAWSSTQERKKLLKGSFRDRHFNAGSILLGLGVLESVGGALNTWFRTGKLFPGPHLFAGAGTPELPRTLADAMACLVVS
jgi:hypothetical protein